MKSAAADTAAVFEQSHLPSLDGLRFFAVLLVILDHSGVPAGAGDGVAYFFVLSGLLFCWLFSREWKKRQDLSLKKFYIRRFFRIMPAFYFSIFFTIFAKKALHFPVNFHHAISAMFYYANYYNAFHGHPATGFDSYWSLSVEEQFYVLWPLCFIFFMRRSKESLVRFLTAAIFAVCAWRSLLHFGFGVNHAYLYNAFDTRFDSLAMGCLLGLLVGMPKFRPVMSRLSKTGYEPLLTLLAIVLTTYISDDFHYSVGFTVQSFFMAVLILQMVLLHKHPLWSWLNHRSLVFLGTLSYSMYLLQGWGIAVGHKFAFLPVGGRVAVGVVAVIGCAACSYYWIERPFLKLRKRWA